MLLWRGRSVVARGPRRDGRDRRDPRPDLRSSGGPSSVESSMSTVTPSRIDRREAAARPRRPRSPRAGRAPAPPRGTSRCGGSRSRCVNTSDGAWPTTSRCPPGATASARRPATSTIPPSGGCRKCVVTRSKDRPSAANVRASTCHQSVRSATPASSACRAARASPLAEKSAPVTRQPWRASQITSPPSPQPTSSAVPGVSSDTSATSCGLGSPLQTFSSPGVALLPTRAARTCPALRRRCVRVRVRSSASCAFRGMPPACHAPVQARWRRRKCSWCSTTGSNQSLPGQTSKWSQG